MINRKHAVDLLLLAVGVAAAVESFSFGIWTPDGGPGNGFFPLLVSCVAALGAATSLVIDLRGAPAAGAPVPAEPRSAAEPETGSLTKPLAYSAVMLVMALVLPWSGFYSAVGVCLVVILWPIEKMGSGKAIVATASALIVTHLVFERALGVHLPHGMFW